MSGNLKNFASTRFSAGRRLKIAAFGTAAVVVLLAGCADEPVRRGNVILISIDTLRADHLGCYGYERPTSPFVDSLAARGVRFENAIVQVPGTLPSHMSMLTGLLPTEHDVFPPDGVLSNEIPLLAELASRAGIRTAGFTEGGYVSGRYGFSRGFERFDDSHRGLNTDFEDGLRQGIEFLTSVQPSQQFFLFLHTYSVHDPYVPPLPYAADYLKGEAASHARSTERVPSDYDLEDASDARLEARKAQQRIASEFVASVLPPDSPMPTGPELSSFNRGRVAIPLQAIPVYEALYDGTINYVDDLLREFVDRLGDLGFDDSTTIIITSDHGEEFLEHGRLVHEQIYNECVHVPLIVVGPGVRVGASIRDLAMSVDLTPTILDLLGVASPRHLSGRSLLPRIQADQTRELEPRDAYAMAFVDPVETIFRMFENRRFQLVAESPQLLEEDPWVEQSINLYPVSPQIDFKAMSYNRPRVVSVHVDGRPWGQLTIRPEWDAFEVQVPDDGNRHVVTMTADECESPASLGQSRDTRCLAFRLRGFKSLRTELFDLAADPNGTMDLSGSSPERAQAMIEALKFFHRKAVASSTSAPLDSETEERLRALGYLE